MSDEKRSEEYKNFNDYDTVEEKAQSAAAAEEPVVQPAPDPNPPTGWAPGYEQSAPAVSTRSPKGIVSIILSFAGYCTYGIASLVGVFLAASALKRNKSDISAKVGLTACILMVIFWAAYIAFLFVTPEGRELLNQIVSEAQNAMEEMASASDTFYSIFK